jgi:hypothetical protein
MSDTCAFSTPCMAMCNGWDVPTYCRNVSAIREGNNEFCPALGPAYNASAPQASCYAL